MQCFYYEAPVNTDGGVPQFPVVGTTVGGFEADHLYWAYCRGLDGTLLYFRLFVYQPGVPIISGAELAVLARDEIDLALPTPQANPPVGAEQLVGVKTWLWVDPATWHPLSATATVPGISATATATPVGTRWTMGDGATVECDGPGTPWTPDGETDCAHVYEVVSTNLDGGVYQAAVATIWHVTWSATDGTGGDLGTLVRSTPFTLLVGQRQAAVR